MTFEWTEALSMGDDSIDRQHQSLFAQTNKLLEVITGEESRPEKVAEVISFLDEYIKEHFAFEEDYLRMYGYPALEEHQALHRDFIRQYAELKAKIDPDRPMPDTVIDLETFLGQWLVHHIGEEDRKYYHFIRKQQA